MVGEEIQGGDINGGVMDETPSSPKSRVKFLCSHGGRILPRPIDGQLKYVGGETRVIAIPRDITFSGFVHLYSLISTYIHAELSRIYPAFHIFRRYIMASVNPRLCLCFLLRKKKKKTPLILHRLCLF